MRCTTSSSTGVPTCRRRPRYGPTQLRGPLGRLHDRAHGAGVSCVEALPPEAPRFCFFIVVPLRQHVRAFDTYQRRHVGPPAFAPVPVHGRAPVVGRAEGRGRVHAQALETARPRDLDLWSSSVPCRTPTCLCIRPRPRSRGRRRSTRRAAATRTGRWPRTSCRRSCSAKRRHQKRTTVVRLTLDYRFAQTNLDTVIGRAAHLAYIDSSAAVLLILFALQRPPIAPLVGILLVLFNF